MTLARLQLAVGAAATLIEELPADGSRRIFAARAPHEAPGSRPSRLVVLHPAPPAGPPAGALLDRMASILALQHPVLVAPLATGTVDTQAWVVEPAPSTATLAERLAEGTLCSVHDTVQLLRDGARALAALHRRGLHHGALDAAALTFDATGARLHALGRRTDGNVSDDLHALGVLATRAMHGDPSSGAPYGRRRHDVPAPLEELLAALTDPQRAQRPATADAVLGALDWFPAQAQRAQQSLLEGRAGRGGRPPGHRQAAMLLGITAVVLLLVWLLVRPR